MSDSVEMTIGMSLVLDEVVRKLMYSIKEENGQKVVVDRELPFRLRYRLNKNKMMLDKDSEWFNQQKLILLAQYGEPEGDSVVIKDDAKMELFKKAVGDLIDTKVSHELMPLEPEDIELVKDPDITVSPEAMTLFIGYLTNDPSLEKDLDFEIKVHTKPRESSSSEDGTVEVPVETKEPVSKATKSGTKKSSSSSTTKKTTTKKSTSTKKTSKKDI